MGVSLKSLSPFTVRLLVFFLLFFVIVNVLGFVYNKSLRKQVFAQTQNELTLISGMKAMQLANWRMDKIAVGSNITENSPLVRTMLHFLRTGDLQAKMETERWMLSIVNSSDFLNAQIIDNTGKVILTVPSDTIGSYQYIKSIVREHKNDTSAVLSDFHTFGGLGIVHLDLTVPLSDKKSVKGYSEALLVLRVNPAISLYRMIQSWPLESSTSETILIRTEGDEAVYLNDLRHFDNAPFGLRTSSENPGDISKMVVAGVSGAVSGLDYRGVKVLASIREVPGTDWILISKTDEAEVLQNNKDQFILTKVIFALFIFSGLSVIGLIFWTRRVRFYREQYDNEIQKQALKKHYDYILKYANDIVLLLDTDLNIVEANDRALEVYQYTYPDLTSMKIRDLRLPGSDMELVELISKIGENGSATYETVHRRKDGTTFPTEISARVFEIDGVRYFQSIGRDITERKEADAALKETEKTYTALFNTVSEAIYVHKLDGIFIDVNPGAERMYGYQRSELIGMSPQSVGALGMNDMDELSRIMQRVFDTGKSEKFEFWGMRKNGEIFPKEVISNKGIYFGEEVIISTARDITDVKKIQNELIQARDKAEENNRLKTAFLHNISHEIRTPMNAIVGFTSLLNDPDLDQQTRSHFAGIVNSSTNQLLSIITDIVDISNIETKQVKISVSDVNINVVLRNLYEQFLINSEKQGIILRYETKLPDSEAVIRTDSTKLIQIISNLLGNALKFTKQGSVVFGYNIIPEFIEFFVKDTGIGIAPEFQERVFERFYQIDNDTSRQFSGAGLGLAICKAYVEILGGTISLQSAAGSGSVFFFTIPVKKSVN
jgi:PAS domain S-box-containing protein